jgi:hypothetical protein
MILIYYNEILFFLFFTVYFLKYNTKYILYDNEHIRYTYIFTFRLIKPCDLQLYEGVSLSSNSESQTEEQSFEYHTK